MKDINYSDGIPMMNETPGNLGEIKINHAVVANIARIAATEIDGVYCTSNNFVEGLTELFSKKDLGQGTRVSEDEAGDYLIEIRVILRFGLPLGKVALQVQENIRDKVSKMTMKNVSRVDVIIDGVRNDEKPKPQSSANPEDSIG